MVAVIRRVAQQLLNRSRVIKYIRVLGLRAVIRKAARKEMAKNKEETEI